MLKKRKKIYSLVYILNPRDSSYTYRGTRTKTVYKPTGLYYREVNAA